jgi:hypothetical protein
MLDTVDISLVGSNEEMVCCSEASERDVTTVEDEIDVVSSNNSVGV